MKKDIWMGLVNISPLEGNDELEKDEQAYTSVLLFANDEKDYEQKVKAYLENEKFATLSIEEVVNYTEIADEYEFDEDIEEAVEFLESTQKPQMTVLQIYNKED